MAMSALDVARALLETGDTEAEWRAACSRAYFATFQYLINHPKCRRFVRVNGPNDHQLLIEFLKQSSDPVLRRIGLRFLPRLRSLRNLADYELDARFACGLAEEAIELAEEIILRRLSP